MAFERPIEADRVEDLGLFSSFLRAPVVGTILWLLGGEDAKKAEEEERERRQSQTERESQEEKSLRDHELKNGDVVDRGKRGSNGEDAPSKTFEPWPQISSSVDSDEDDAPDDFPSHKKFVAAELSTPSHLLRRDSGPASRVVDELVAVMDASSLDERRGMKKRSPRSSSRSDLASLDDGSTVADLLSSSSSPKKLLPPSTHKLPSSSNLSSTSKKKMSWSDETGQQPLVEYFDDRTHLWRYRRNNSWKPSRSFSFDSQEKATSSRDDTRGGRSKVRVIKSALRRSGSYSPPMQIYEASCHSDSVCSSSSQHSSTSGTKSFRSLSVVGSTSSDSMCCESPDESRNVPSGCGRTNGGLVIPTGGPVAYLGYQVTLGTAVPPSTTVSASQDHQEESKTLTPNSEGTTPAASTVLSAPHPHSSRQSSKPHHFLPHHSNGYISPQYGFYVNITPPTPEMFYPRPPPGHSYDNKLAGKATTVQQQSYQQFTKQQPYRPSPIPEVTTAVSPYNENNPPMQPVFQDASPHGTPRDAKKKTTKPTFNKKRMGMFLSENPHHQVWPTVPFG